MERERETDGWSCPTCTFLNQLHATVCDMCHKSRPTRDERRTTATTALQLAAGVKTTQDTQEEYSLVIDAVENFLRGAEWKHTMNTFVNGHCAMFAVIDGEHGLGQHDIFRDFRDTVDGLLDGILSSLGSSPEVFIEALKAKERAPER